MKTIEFDQECASCGGTGLYVGFAEVKGAAVVCNSCGGKGHYTFKHEYKEFTGLKNRPGVVTVFQRNMGRVLGPGSPCGLTYKDWLDGKSFSGKEDRENYCPAWWYQNVDYKKKPEWDECIGCGAFSDCKDFKTKSDCWKKWDKQFGKASR